MKQELPGILTSVFAIAGGNEYELIEAGDPDQRFERIVLNRTMLQDHLCTTYKAALRGMLKALPKV